MFSTEVRDSTNDFTEILCFFGSIVFFEDLEYSSIVCAVPSLVNSILL